MDKIMAILANMGITEISRKEFKNILVEWANGKEKKLNEEYRRKLAAAKKSCIEETEAHKAKLSQGVQVFLENRIESIEKAAHKKLAIEEPETINKLKHIKALCEGIDIDGAAVNAELQAMKKEKAAVAKELVEAKNQIRLERGKTAKLQEISEKFSQRTRLLEGKIKELENQITEAKAPKPSGNGGQTLAESKQHRPKPKTRRVVTEDRKPRRPQEPVDDIDAIAASL